MHTFRIIQITMVAVVCFLSCAVAADKVSTFSSLPKGDELEMTFTTSGCFHFATYELKFRRSTDLTVSIVQIEREWSVDGKAFTSTNRVNLGDLTLTWISSDETRRVGEQLITNRYPQAQLVSELGVGRTFTYRFATNGTVLPISAVVDRKIGKARFESSSQ